MNKNRLLASVEARNAANAALLQVAPVLLEALKPLVGTKIMRADGGRTAKLEKVLAAVLAPANWTHGARLWVNCNGYSLSLNTSVSRPVKGESGCRYGGATFYLGDRDGTLKSLRPAPTAAGYPTDYDADAILAAREAVKAARAALRDAESKLYGFGEYDHN